MKYCISCNMNLGDVELLELENGETGCPKCENELLEFKSTKLETLIKDITNAFYNIKEPKVQNDAQELIKNAKTIEIGEKRLKKEYIKRLTQIKSMEYELAVIQSIGDKVKYSFERK